MAQFEIDVKIIVDADDETEATYVASGALENLIGGSIVEYEIDGVTDIEMIAK